MNPSRPSTEPKSRPACQCGPPDGAVLVCRCREVSREQVRAAIAAGASTLEDLKRETGVTMGLCQGRTCGRLVATLLAAAGACEQEQTLPRHARSPVRPLPLGMLAAADEPPETP
jgi:bacterioferritin-associated ferredoxin